MLLAIFLFDEDGNEYDTGETIDHIDSLEDHLGIFEALQDMHHFTYSMRFDDLEFLPPHPDEIGVSNIAMRIREKNTHDQTGCIVGPAQCSVATCREWYSSNLTTMINIRMVES